jgi:DNA-binding response OmpR family regulator
VTICAGTTMRLLFPVSAAAASSTSRTPPGQLPHRGLRILLVDDERALSEALRNALELEGHQVTVADGGHAGLEAFRSAQRLQESFDIVITDLGMPNVDGRQVVAGVRAASPATPIILLTGWSQQMAAQGDRALQADRLLGKPPRLAELRTAIAELTADVR